MKNRMLLALALLVSMSGAVQAQGAALPPAREVIARYLEATKLPTLVTRYSSVRKKGTLASSAGLTGTIEMLNAKPNRSLSRIEVPAIGQLRKGYDGEHAWAMDAMQGPRLLAGVEQLQTRDEAGYAFSLRDSMTFRVRETVEVTEMGGERCYKLRMVTNSGRESHDCFSVETGLLVATQGKVTSQMGEREHTVTYSDYKEFGGILFPTKAVQSSTGQQATITLETIEFDTVKPEEFQLPPEVRALIKG